MLATVVEYDDVVLGAVRDAGRTVASTLSPPRRK